MPPTRSLLNKDNSSGGDSSSRHLMSEDTTTMQHQSQQHRNKDKGAVAVAWARILVVAVLLLSAGLVGSLTYLFVSGNEQEDFENRFEENAAEVIQAASGKADETIKLAIQMASIFASYATESGAVLPFFTLYDFETFAQSIRRVSGATLFAYTPYLANEDLRNQWEEHAKANQQWVPRGHAFLSSDFSATTSLAAHSSTHPEEFGTMPEKVWMEAEENNLPGVVDNHGAPYTPLWQMSPAPNTTERLNLNLYRQADEFVQQIEHVRKTRRYALSPPVPVRDWLGSALPRHDTSGNARHEEEEPPQSLLMLPVDSSLDPSQAYFSGVVSAVIPFAVYFSNFLQSGANGILVVVDSCGIQHSYLINGPDVEFLGEDDWHDSAYNSMVVEGLLNQPQAGAAPYCQHRLRVYPTATFEEIHKTGDPVFYTIVIIAFFGFAVLVFVIYDILVSRRQKKTQFKANRTDEIVEQLFPEHVREKLFREETTTFEKDLDATATANKFVSDGENRSMGDKPIAELFPEATVLFADIAGFTAWSSIREPSHVFILLESIFRAFDEVAPKYGIFKVETVGDCYVAACGVPQYQKNHALLMAKFSRECMDRFEHVVGGLELELGPDTSDLAMRMGMHSGPVTAGVLRGDRARFQLFGDTVNTAAAIEHTGSRERIQVSEQTAGLLTASGKHDWLTPREDLVEGKGQERLKTFWLQLKSEQAAALGQTMGSNIGDEDKVNTEETEVEHKNGITVVSSGRRDRPSMKSSIANRERRLQRLVDWNCELLAQLLKQVVARRHALNLQSTSGEKLTKMATLIGDGTMVVDEVAEIIDMPDFKACTKSIEPVQLTDIVMTQLHQYVSAIASLYLDNPFHNFEHASHVTMSVSKLLSRIVAPQALEGGNGGTDERRLQERMHDHTYGITSDPLTQFAVVLSALIHDVDHRGVPNFILASEDKGLAACYKGKSLAEQNSVDLAWNTLMSEEFEELRQHIFADAVELRRFRQLLVNSVIATDIFDKDLSTLRKNRWNKAFHDMEEVPDDDIGTREHIDRKATIVIEHLIQASDVAHTMQHWHVYQKWNQRLFDEMYDAYLTGRSDKDPSANWYKGEIGFFDNYIIPLAKKLKECGVFGVSSDEYLNYAIENRKEWAMRGEEIVAKFVDTYSGKNQS